MAQLFQYATLASSVILCILILMQTRGASLGAGFGGASSDTLHTTRRGADKTLHRITVFVAIFFIFSIMMIIVQG